MFSKYGKLAQLDFLYHKAGALKGKPRGYAFVEYGNPDVSHLLFDLASCDTVLSSFTLGQSYVRVYGIATPKSCHQHSRSGRRPGGRAWPYQTQR